MISISGREWKEEKVSKRLVEKIEQEYNFSKIVSKLIVSRNFDKEEIYSINNKLKISNFFQNNPDFINSVKLVEKLINKGSERATRCVEIAGGSPLTEKELLATKKSEINTECPSIANPNYEPY